MIELGISQVQAQFTKLLTQTVLVIDKKSHIKKAVIMPYEEYELLINRAKPKEQVQNGLFNQFVGTLKNDFKTDDEKYNRIVS